MKKKVLFTLFLFLTFNLLNFGCECEHIHDPEIMAEVDQEKDEYNDDQLYANNFNGQPQNDPERFLKKAAYAFDSFKYNKCLEYIKTYEKQAFPPPFRPTGKDKLKILAYKAYSKKALKKYDSAIEFFEEMLVIDNDLAFLNQECVFITYLEHAFCYLLKGDREGGFKRIKKIFDMQIAPTYDYYVRKDFFINHQPCFHDHTLNQKESFIFNEIAPILLGEELYAAMKKNQQTPKFYTVAKTDEDKERCRRLCARASYLSAMVVACITKSGVATAVTGILGELLVDCDTCCEEGWGSSNCLRDLKTALWNVSQQHKLDDM